ncbi:MAG: ABC transporter substrate-binding protein [Pseudomonadota bacterium]
MRIVSLLPSATDIVVALGAADDLVGVSHSCSGDWDHLPKLTSTWVDTGASAADIDEQVTTASRPLYQLDIEALERLKPDVVISQSLCDVCAVPAGDVREAVLTLSSTPHLIDLSPDGLDDVPLCFRQVGDGINRRSEASRLERRWHDTFATYRNRHADKDLRLVFLDWLDPPFVAGHWVPEMVEWLGVTNLLGVARKPSFKATWDTINASQPDVLIAACCGFGVEQAELENIPVACPVIHLDGHLHFSRPSPALMPSLEMLAQTIESFCSKPRQPTRLAS